MMRENDPNVMRKVLLANITVCAVLYVIFGLFNTHDLVFIPILAFVVFLVIGGYFGFKDLYNDIIKRVKKGRYYK